MKFGDKLILLRKKNGLSQEELAEKLGVSRQSVSKWESNNTYPETDKIVQICNLFNCSMDDLINDKITDIEQIDRVSKSNLNEMWDSLLEFITKTVSMFSRMKFMDGMKCVIELIIISILLHVMGSMICGLAGKTISHLFVFLNDNTVLTIGNVITNICNLFWFILSFIVLIYVFKIRYLNEYDKVIEEEHAKDNNSDEKEGKANIKNSKGEKIIIRDENEKPFAFLGGLSKFVLCFIKFVVAWFSLGIIATIIGLTIVSFMMIFMIPNNILFVGLSMSSVAGTVIAIIILLICIYFIMSKQIPVKIYSLIFVISLLLLGMGIGISVTSIKNLDMVEHKDSKYLEDKVTNISYEDNLVILSNDVDVYNYVIDSNMEDNQIVIVNKIDPRYEKVLVRDSINDNMPVKYVSSGFNGNYKNAYNDFVDNLKKNKIVGFYNNGDVIIKGNEKTIEQLKNNLKKLFLIEESINNNTIKITLHDSKVYFPNGVDGEYDAVSDTLTLIDENDQCERSVKSTKWGERIIFTCRESEDD